MRAGRLRHQVVLQTPIGTPNSYGENEVSWQDFATARAAIEPLRGREYDAARQQNAETTHRILLRWREGVLPVMRIVFGTRIFRIDEILNINERNRELYVRATELRP